MLWKRSCPAVSQKSARQEDGRAGSDKEGERERARKSPSLLAAGPAASFFITPTSPSSTFLSFETGGSSLVL